MEVQTYTDCTIGRLGGGCRIDLCNLPAGAPGKGLRGATIVRAHARLP